MKRLRRIAAVVLALLLGLAAWFTVLLRYPSTGELRLARQLSTGSLIARVPEPRPLFFGRIVFGPPLLGGRFLQTDTGNSGPIQPGTVWADRPKAGEQIWYIRLDPKDKAWEIELVEKRPVFLRVGAKSWRIGTTTRVWRTNRTGRADD
jgi:hypothetical protein